MKRLLVGFAMLLWLLPLNTYAKSSTVQKHLSNWLDTVVGEELEFSFEKRKIQFRGCKQKAYDLVITRQFGDDFSVDMSLGYAKGRNSFGVYSHTVLVKEFELMPRWQLGEFTIGLGLKKQSSHSLRSSHAASIQLPLRQAWAFELDLPTFNKAHAFRMKLEHEKWQHVDSIATINNAASNNAIALEYAIAF
ncbi:hypothetical protein [Alteromonas flava]|uniref:hypothetical protein n=1 Tax=Alteromonas flava TaxID=2048003 RepID=UPI000C28AF95|nr:hypothetical protein [Alteromonas flava]